MTTDILNSMELQMPDSVTLAKFEEIVAPMYLAMQHNKYEANKLTALRDVLLPKLMSGELDISNIDL
jgi:type I restriction enzyme S subunit